MALVDQQLFSDPRSEPARRLCELREIRRELQRQHREAVAQRQAALAELDEAARAVRQAEGRATAFNDQEALKAAKARQSKAEKAARTAGEEDNRFSQAITAVDDEITAVARQHYDELVGETVENHEAAAREVEGLVQQLRDAYGRLVEAYRGASVLTSSVGDRQRNAAIRDPAPLERLVVDGKVPTLYRDLTPSGWTVEPMPTDDPEVLSVVNGNSLGYVDSRA